MRPFLEALYSDLPDGAWWYLWTLSPSAQKQTVWLAAGAAGIAQAEALATTLNGVNVYYPIAWATAQGSPDERIKASHAAGIVGLISDLDFVSSTKPNGFPNEAVAIETIGVFPLRPSACIHSGHGLQCVWLFREPWEFDGEPERDRAASLSVAWGYTLASIANRRGFELDAVHDLARVMRLPGCVNCKDPARPVQTRVLWLEAERRFNPSDFEPYLVEVPPSAVKLRVAPVDISSDFPMVKHELLLEVDDDYRATWKHERKMPSKDSSASVYDLALANIAVQAGWTDNEIAALLIEHQKRNGNKPEKLGDARYYARTIAKARESQRKGTEQEEATATLSDDESEPEDVLRSLATRFQIPLTAIQFVSGDPAVFRFWIGGRCAEIEATAMTTQQRFLGEVLSVAGVFPVPVGQKEKPPWRDLVNAMVLVAERLEAGKEATRAGNFEATVWDYAEGRAAPEFQAGELVPRGCRLFTRNSRLWLRLADLSQYMRIHQGGNLGRNTIAQKLRVMGAIRETHATEGREQASTSTASYYGLDLTDRPVS